MENVVEPCTFMVGAFVVRQAPRFDNPRWAVFIVFLGERLIGKCFSRPDQEWCSHLLRRANAEITYQPAPRKAKLRGVALERKGNSGKTERHGWSIHPK